MMKKLLTALALLGALPLLGACNSSMNPPNPTVTSGAAAQSQVGKLNEKDARTKDPTTPNAPP